MTPHHPIEGVSPFWRTVFSAWLSHRRLCLLLCSIAVLVAGTGVTNLDVDLNVESLFARDDGKLATFREYTASFGRDDDVLVLLCEVDRLDSKLLLPALARLCDGLESLGLFSDVRSLLDAPHVWSEDDICLGLGPMRDWLMPRGSPKPERLALLLSGLSPEGPILGNFLAPDARSVILSLKLNADHADNRGRMAATVRLRDWLASNRAPPFLGFTVSGMPAARADGMRMIQKDQSRLLPLSLLATLLVVFASFGRAREVALVMAHVVLTLVITLGTMGHLGIRFSFLSSVTPVILVTTGSCYSIQILARIRSLQARHLEVGLGDLFATMVGPIFLANFTTIIGFLSLMSTSMQLINEFAAITAAGVFVAYVLTITIFPLLVATFPGQSPAANVREESRALTRLLTRSALFIVRRPRPVFVGLALVGLSALALSARVRVAAFVFDDFKPDSPLMTHIRRAEDACRGLLPMGITIRSTRQEAVLRHHFLAKAHEIAGFLRKQPEVGKVDSPSDFVGQVYGHLTGAMKPGTFPADDRSLAETIRLVLVSIGGEPGQRLVSKDLSALQIPFRVKDLESRDAARFIDRVRAHLKALEDDRTRVDLSGTTVMIQETYRDILGNLVSGFAVVAFVTVVILSVSFPHPASLGIACVANAIPMVVVIGLMGVMGITFKPSTTMIFGIALGLAVDNTIYFMKEYWRASRAGRPRERTVIRALRRAGGGILQSSTSLLLGFLILLFSEFEAQFLIGLLLSVSVSVALACDFLLVPAGMCMWGPRAAEEQR